MIRYGRTQSHYIRWFSPTAISQVPPRWLQVLENIVKHLQESSYHPGLEIMEEDRKLPYELESKFLILKHNL